MAKPFGKNINLQKIKSKRPSNNALTPRQLNTIHNLNNTRKKSQYRWDGNKNPSTTGYMGGDTNGGASATKRGWSVKYSPGYTNPFYLFLCDNAICELSKKIKPGAATTINIANPTGHLGINLLRKDDYFYIYNTTTYKSIRLQCKSDLADNATSITIPSTTFVMSDNYPPGSIVVPDYKVQTQRLSNVPNFKKYELTQTQYQNLNTSPLELLPATANVLHIPLSATLVYKHDSDEMTRADLFIGHNATSSVIGQYWSRYNEAFYRIRDSLLAQMTVGTYNTTTAPGIPLISARNNGVGLALKMYTSVNFTGTSGLTVYLYYKSIEV